MPSSLDGTPTPQTASVQAFIAALKTRTPLPIATEDERLTSREAESRLARAREGLAEAQSNNSTRRLRPCSSRIIWTERSMKKILLASCC